MSPPCFWDNFIDTALFNTAGPFSLSYADPDQKWLIRNHLLSLLRHHPSFSLSSSTFHHDDGAAVNLLTASGDLLVSAAAPAVHVTVWVHQDYPRSAPMVFVAPPPSDRPGAVPVAVHRNHPFVGQSGAVTCPCLLTWQAKKSNLLTLVRNLVNVFSVDHPFHFPVGPTPAGPPTLASRAEALDRLVGSLHYDVVVARSVDEDEIEGLAKLQSDLVERGKTVFSLVSDVERERAGLRRRVAELTERADVVSSWTRANSGLTVNNRIGGCEYEDEVETADEESEAVVECLAADRAIEDLMYALDKGVEEGAVSFEAYMKQVRGLAREQFWHRATLVNIIHFLL